MKLQKKSVPAKVPRLQSGKRWRWLGFAVFNVLAFFLLISWLWEPTRYLWDKMDDQIFTLLNGSLANRSAWARLWAFTNMRIFDIIIGLVMLFVLLKKNLLFDQASIRRSLLLFVTLLGFLLILRTIFSSILDGMSYQRHSPSLVMNNAIRLSELFPDWGPKDKSRQSFPGDHASVTLLWAIFLTFFANGWRLITIWTIAMIAILPRLVAGAHWGSDDFVGGLFLVFLSIAWGYFTPLGFCISSSLEKLTYPIIKRLGHLPIARHLALFK